MGRIKGVNLAHSRDFVEAEYGAEGWALVAARLPAETRDALESGVAVGWYPAHLHLDLLRVIDATFSTGATSILPRLGAHDAEFDVTRIHRILFRFANPGYLLEKVGGIWARYFDTGEWSVVRPSATTCQASLADFAIVDPLYCAYLMAYFHRLFELAGARAVSVAHPSCRARGDAVCRFDGAWR